MDKVDILANYQRKDKRRASQFVRGFQYHPVDAFLKACGDFYPSRRIVPGDFGIGRCCCNGKYLSINNYFKLGFMI
jgi:hypothetical protein